MIGSTRTSAFKLLRMAAQGFIDDNAMAFSAALSYYTLLSFAPLIILAVWVSASLGLGAQEALLEQIGLLVGPEARDVARSITENAQNRPDTGNIAGIISIGVSLVAATTVFAQLQHSLNQIWKIDVKPGNAIWSWLRRRILSIGVIAAGVFVAVVSLIFSALIGLFLNQTGPLWSVFNQIATAIIFSALFAGLFRYLPDARLPWRDALQGGVVTAILFSIGKSLLGVYLASGSAGGPYGGAASLVLLMIWIYYASAIFFFGAEFVQAKLNADGRRIPVSSAGIRKEDAS